MKFRAVNMSAPAAASPAPSVSNRPRAASRAVWRTDPLAEPTSWRASLDFILSETDGLPLTHFLRGVCYSVSLLGLMLPFATVRDVAAGYWWTVWRRLN